jgi:hypothetical protein
VEPLPYFLRIVSIISCSLLIGTTDVFPGLTFVSRFVPRKENATLPVSGKGKVVPVLN